MSRQATASGPEDEATSQRVSGVRYVGAGDGPGEWLDQFFLFT